MRRRLLVAAALAFVLAVGVLVSVLAGRSADGSSLARHPAGWLAARLYLESREVEATVADRPLDEVQGRGVLALVFPWQRLAFGDDLAGAERWLHRGGTVLFAYSGQLDQRGEMSLASRFDLKWKDLGPPPLEPRAWRVWADREWDLRGEGPLAGSATVRVSVPRRVPVPPDGATVLHRAGDGTPVVFSWPRFRGRVLALPADALANRRLTNAGNADLLEALAAGLGESWTFDEHHHGLVPVAAPGDGRAQRTFDLFLLQVAFVYLLAVAAVARRFGPPWREPPALASSVAAFLTGLGAVHHRLGHHGAAGRQLVARARELEPRLVLDEGDVTDARSFLRLAQDVGRAQRGGGEERGGGR